MTLIKRISTFMMITALLLSGMLLVAAKPADDGKELARAWSNQMWSTALDSSRERIDGLRKQFDSMPAASFDPELLNHFRKSDLQNRSNEEQALLKRDEDRIEAIQDMREQMAKEDLSESLFYAVKVQTLSEDYNEAFRNEDILEIISRVERELPQKEAQSRWLEAQELAYRMRTLYDDTDRLDEYDRYDKRLTKINRRVSLLAQYAPRQLHAYRVRRAEELGEDAPAPFNAVRADVWQEKLEGINERMLVSSLRKASSDHIESEHWRPLLEGGLEALMLFVTTPALSETFPSLSKQKIVNEFVAFLNSELNTLSNAEEKHITSRTFKRLLKRLIVANDQTLKLPAELLYREYGDGAMFRLDRFSEIEWPDKLRRFEQSTQGNFVGVGIIIRASDANEIMVVNPLEGAPAYYAGIKPGDLIMEVNGESTVGWSTNDAVNRITGKSNTTVILGIKREGEDDLLQFKIVRKSIKLRSVNGWWKERLTADGEPVWDWFIDSDTRIAYIKLTQFTSDTFRDIEMAWLDIQKAGGANGLILDLRYNPGGLLLSAVQISNLFVESGVILSGEDKFGREAFSQRASPHRAKFAGLPTVVLINKGSASASEIVAGCLQAHGAAVIVGERSYGKGSVQTVHMIAENCQLKLTTQYYRLPPNIKEGETRGRVVHKRPRAKMWGVDPDILVTMTPSQSEDSYFLRQQADIIPEDEDGHPDPDSSDRPDIDELMTKGLDPQLETALLLLQARALGEINLKTRHASIK